MKYFLPVVLILLSCNLYAQNSVKDAVLRHLEEHKTEWQLTTADLENPVITDEYTSRHSGVTHLYMRQTHAGIEVYNAIINVNVLSDGSILNVGNRFVSDLSGKVNATTPNTGALDAVQAAARDLELQIIEPFSIQKNISSNEYEISEGGIAAKPIKVKLMYLPIEEEGVRLVWQLGIYTKNHQHNWKMSVDATTGQILKKRDAVLHCDFGTPHPVSEGCQHSHVHPPTPSKGGEHSASEFPPSEGARGGGTLKSNLISNVYNVYPTPVESPIHGDRVLMTNPSDSLASPFGWHDTNGVPGPEFTFTQGNNVRATEDRDDNGGLGYVPDGGDSLVFDFPIDFSLSPIDNQDASITNLFYWNNIMHDIWYQYGFDEVSGNFQDNNYGRGGSGGDFVIAEAQDGSGTNNANFSSPEDGSNGRMQMYLWNPTAGGALEVNEPMSIAGSYDFSGAAFGPSGYNVTGTLVEAFDPSAMPELVCGPVYNVEEVMGNIAVIERGECFFVDKVMNAQNAGAIAVIICNQEPAGTVTMGGDDPGITIPSVMLSNQDCATIRAVISEGVEVTMERESLGSSGLDSGYDNGIITHEYGHGVSIRLTGGPNNSGCLSNDQQMGEGWSDWLSLVMTPVSDSDGAIPRGIGNYASGGNVNSVGIRTYHYTTDMNVNPHTYSDIPSESIPHGVGSIWCAMIWDLYWALVEVHGFDEDMYTGTGGNNIAMQLVLDGMKLQTCSPDFVDGRDAILLADEALYNGANRCLIWEVFARRGLGFSANTSPIDAFDIHPICLDPVAPIANFDVNSEESCSGRFCFTDLSENFPESWAWDFGDGNTSSESSPTHEYTEVGTYTVTLEVVNQIGSANHMTTVTVNELPQTPVIESSTCVDDMATLTASTTSGTIEWQDENGNIYEGAVFEVPPIFAPTTFTVQSVIDEIGKIGPEDSSYGDGGYHNTGFRGEVGFEVYQPFTLLSVWINAGSAGNKQFDLENANGQVINSVTVNVPQIGPQRVDIGWNIDEPGDYVMAAESVNLYRNSNGTVYPYGHCSGALSITRGPSASGAGYYYYFYDWEIQTKCTSESVSIDVDCVAVGIEDNPAVKMFNIFPNPNHGTFNIELAGEAEENIELRIFDVLGQAIYVDNYDFYSGKLNAQIDLQNIAPGTYIIKLTVRDRASYQKIVVY